MTVDEFARAWLKRESVHLELRDPRQKAISYLLQLIAADHIYRLMYDYDLPAPEHSSSASNDE